MIDGSDRDLFPLYLFRENVIFFTLALLRKVFYNAVIVAEE